jgi:DMSO/TMAO reductase YedYZ molybdopterin-dependent catalytic subunit
MNYRKIGIMLLMLAAVAGAALALQAKKTPDAAKLQNAEVKEYKGEKLGSSKDFRENSIRGPQKVDREKYRLSVTGLVEKPKTYSYADIAEKRKHFKKVVTLHCVEGWSVKILWEGVLARDLIGDSAPKAAANTVIFYAADGYTTSLPLDYIMDPKRNILIADRMNGVELPPARGFPFELVAENKWGYKWIKWITKIELSDNPNFKGYWEKNGYSNDADLQKGFFDN